MRRIDRPRWVAGDSFAMLRLDGAAAAVTPVPVKVLVVDDDALALRSIARTLELAGGFVVDVCDRPDDARERLLTGEYAVLVTDYQMPVTDGVALIESVESRCDTVPVLLTGHAAFDVVLDAVNRGHVYAFIAKPLRPQQLVATVRRAAERFDLGRALHVKVAELEQANAELTRRNSELESARAELERLQELAATDHKTGAHSYRFFVQRLEEEVARSRRYHLPLSLLLVDLDGFKAANDRLGHRAGDDVLRGVAKTLSQGVRLMDVVSRYGGDEFTVLLPNTTKVGAAVLAERLRVGLEVVGQGPAAAGAITASIGIASLPDEAIDSPEELIEAADRALYVAKTGGRNRCVLASPERVGGARHRG